MTAIRTRNSALAIKVETTEGTPVSPTGAGDFLALQDDFAMASDRDTLENAEIRQSLANSKPIQGFENPTFTFSHYLRHSGTEGTAPDPEELYQAAFGSEEVNATEYDTIAASTVSLIKVDVGEGATFSKGEGLLVKDGTNGYSIRCVDSVATDDLTPNFDLANAPGTGVNLGKAVFYKPANTGHQSLTVWNYLDNVLGGAVQMMSGGRVTEMAITAEAGALINTSWSMEGLKAYFNPIEITATDTFLDFTDDTGTFAAQITAKTYTDPHELADALAAAMNAVTVDNKTVTYSDTTGKFTIADTTTPITFSLLWSTGGNAANTVGDKIGFLTAADDTGSASYEGDNAITLTAPFTPSLDSADPIVAKNQEILMGDSTDITCLEVSSMTFTLSDVRRPIDDICAETGRSSSIINERTAVLTVSALLNQYDVSKWKKFRENDNVKFQYAFGEKDSSGNWVAGKSGCIYMSDAVITSHAVVDDDGLISLDLEVTAYVNANAEDEVFLNFL